MSEPRDPQTNTTGGPTPRPRGDGLPPKTGGELKRPASEDPIDSGVAGAGGDRGAGAGGRETGGMLGEG